LALFPRRADTAAFEPPLLRRRVAPAQRRPTGEGTLADGSLQALVDAPGITRSVINYKRLLLTDLTVDISKSPDKETLKAALAAGDIEGKWAASSWGKKLARQDAKKKASDFDRFKAAKAKTARSKLIAAKLS